MSKYAFMLVVGIDENGLGPVLGPLVVTAAAFETKRYDALAFWNARAAGILTADSKELFSAGKMKSAESATLSWLKAFGLAPDTFKSFFDAVVVPLALPCEAALPFCLPSDTPLPAWQNTAEEKKESIASALFEGAEPAPFAVKAHVLCPGAFNEATSSGVNKFALDARLMLSLFEHICEGYDGEALGLLGKVGSTRRYGPWLEGAGWREWTTETESRDISTYRTDRKRTISFIRDGDASHLPIAVASMIGKYLRELSMRDLNDRLSLPGVRRASGYPNRVTAELIEKSREKRESMGLRERCFIRSS